MHCALAALLDEDPGGAAFCVAEKRGKLFNRITLLLKTILIL